MHTPGPWRITTCGKHNPGDEAWRRCARISDSNGQRLDMTLANMRLKAAAPELLAVLRDMTEHMKALATESEYPQSILDAEDLRAKINGEV